MNIFIFFTFRGKERENFDHFGSVMSTFDPFALHLSEHSRIHFARVHKKCPYESLKCVVIRNSLALFLERLGSFNAVHLVPSVYICGHISETNVSLRSRYIWNISSNGGKVCFSQCLVFIIRM